MKRVVRRLLHGLDRELVRYSASSDRRRLRILELAGVDVVLDVGANAGQYGERLRESGFGGRIVSFEPQPDQFARLTRRAAGDPAWECRNLALGDREGTADLNVGTVQEMSSFLGLPRHLDAGRSVTVPLRRLDSIAADLLLPGERTLLKTDTEGYELEVLRGAGNFLGTVRVVEVELLLMPVYEGQRRFDEVIDYLESEGFAIVDLLPGYFHWETGRLLHADGLFVREG